jgi:hypothetical protein
MIIIVTRADDSLSSCQLQGQSSTLFVVRNMHTHMCATSFSLHDIYLFFACSVALDLCQPGKEYSSLSEQSLVSKFVLGDKISSRSNRS